MNIKTYQFCFIVLLFTIGACDPASKSKPGFIKENIQFAAAQEKLQVEAIEKSGKILNPRTIESGKVKYIPMDDWTSGFYPGTMWYMYELTGDSTWKKLAVKYTEAIDYVKYLTWHHDVGFMIQCSFGNAFRLTGDSAYKAVIVQAAKSLSTRFHPIAGITQSWNIDKGWQSERGWECPVIIDNMMNLELLFNATKLTGDSSFYKIAVSHADKPFVKHEIQNICCKHKKHLIL